jgi:hypothetical protein
LKNKRATIFYLMIAFSLEQTAPCAVAAQAGVPYHPTMDLGKWEAGEAGRTTSSKIMQLAMPAVVLTLSIGLQVCAHSGFNVSKTNSRACDASSASRSALGCRRADV